jgi:quinohemoprotein amine dehydrogenase
MIKVSALALACISPTLALANTGPSGESLLNSLCIGCHTQTDSGLSRISEQRKTPEAWEMTINRMRLVHGLQLNHSDLPPGEIMARLVKHLADTQGLAPSETTGVRYLLERDVNRTESFEPLLAETCGRCHSGARVALQRRTQQEWDRTIDFHLGQWPSTEYSLLGRDRPWLSIAREQVVPMLAREYAFDNKAWAEWLAHPKPSAEGTWVTTGHIPAEGNFIAIMSATLQADDRYDLSITGRYADGETFEGRGVATIYSGFEWRGRISVGDETYHQALALSPEGSELSGRFYLQDQEAIGMQVSSLKVTDEPQILSIYPKHLKRGTTATLSVMGTNLQPEDLQITGVIVENVLSADAHHVVLSVSVPSSTKLGYHTVGLAGASSAERVAVYDRVDALAIEPAYGVARIGGNGGGAAKVESVFRAVGTSWGADRLAGTDDDLELGYIDNVLWEAVPRDDTAAHDDDVKFAGQLDRYTGRFIPAAAGPNPERFRSTNNAGNLNVVATYEQADETLSATGRLLVTVQRWINPPLK